MDARTQLTCFRQETVKKNLLWLLPTVRLLHGSETASGGGSGGGFNLLLPPPLPTLSSSNLHGTQLWPAGSVGPSARQHSVFLVEGKGQRTMLPGADPPTTAIAPPPLTSTSSLLAGASAVRQLSPPPPPSPPEQQQRGSAVVPAIAGYSATGPRWGLPRQRGYACRTSGKRMRWGSSLKNGHRQ